MIDILPSVVGNEQLRTKKGKVTAAISEVWASSYAPNVFNLRLAHSL